MGLSDIDDEGRLIFLTNRGSHKWAQLSIHPAISILLLNIKQNVQIIVRGQAELLTLESHSSLLEHYWLCTPRQAQFTFLDKNPEGEFIPLNGSLEIAAPPENFGMIRVLTANWEILVIDSDNYHVSPRFRFEKNGSNWLKTRLNAI